MYLYYITYCIYNSKYTDKCIYVYIYYTHTHTHTHVCVCVFVHIYTDVYIGSGDGGECDNLAYREEERKRREAAFKGGYVGGDMKEAKWLSLGDEIVELLRDGIYIHIYIYIYIHTYIHTYV
jgi:hypothetical protein